MTAWVERFGVPAGGAGGVVRVAVKDAIDVAGAITGAGCAVVRERAVPAVADADCLGGVRAAGAYLVGKTALTELCVSPYGENAGFGMPVNPVAPGRIPGGSSSGSAVVVAAGEADVGLGTDTGGSVRIPAACCGVVGLKTTWGRVPVGGVWPLAPSLDTVGPLARDVDGIVTGMGLLVPGFTVAPRAARVVGRLRVPGVEAVVEEAVDAALEAAGIGVREVRLPGWDAAHHAFGTIVVRELWEAHPELLDAAGVSGNVNGGLRAGRAVIDDELAEAMAVRAGWRSEVAALFGQVGGGQRGSGGERLREGGWRDRGDGLGGWLGGVELLVLPTLPGVPPLLDAFEGFPATSLTAPFNLAGVPALAMPVPSPGLPVSASLQLVGPGGGEELICATALAIERALGSL